MIRWTWVLPIWLLLSCEGPVTPVPATATVAANTNDYPTTLPQSLLDHLTTSFPQWRMVDRSDYSKTWWSFYDSSYNPCWARTDINDDERADYAIWLKKDNQLRLVIFTGLAGHSFAHYIVHESHNAFNEKEHNLAMGVAIAPPAQIDVVSPRIQSLILKSNGFTLMELEERVAVYYWKNGVRSFMMK